MRLKKTVHIKKNFLQLFLQLTGLIRIICDNSPVGSLQCIISLSSQIKGSILDSIGHIEFIIPICLCHREKRLDSIEIMFVDIHCLASVVSRTLLPDEAGIICKIIIHRLTKLIPECCERGICSSITCFAIRLQECIKIYS